MSAMERAAIGLSDFCKLKPIKTAFKTFVAGSIAYVGMLLAIGGRQQFYDLIALTPAITAITAQAQAATHEIAAVKQVAETHTAELAAITNNLKTFSDSQNKVFDLLKAQREAQAASQGAVNASLSAIQQQNADFKDTLREIQSRLDAK